MGGMRSYNTRQTQQPGGGGVNAGRKSAECEHLIWSFIYSLLRIKNIQVVNTHILHPPAVITHILLL